jgi:uncharacterized protein (UPF0248 family)
VLGSNLDRDICHPNSRGFLQSLQQNAEIIPILGNDRTIPNHQILIAYKINYNHRGKGTVRRNASIADINRRGKAVLKT